MFFFIVVVLPLIWWIKIYITRKRYTTTRYSYSYNGRLKVVWSIEWHHFQWPWMTLNPDSWARHYSTYNISNIAMSWAPWVWGTTRKVLYKSSCLIPFFMLLLKTKRPSTLTGPNVRLSNLMISSSKILGLRGVADRLKCCYYRFIGLPAAEHRYCFWTRHNVGLSVDVCESVTSVPQNGPIFFE